MVINEIKRKNRKLKSVFFVTKDFELDKIDHEQKRNDL